MLLLLICSRSIFLSAQMTWTVYDMSNSGIPENNVKSLAIDQQKRKWIGTDNGLAVFNDTSWVIYNTSNSGLPDNTVIAVVPDDNGNIWIGTMQGGLTKFDGTNWQTWNTSNSGLPNDFVRAVAFDSTGNIWIGTSDGLVKYDGNNNWQVWDFNNSPLLSTNITSIVIGNNNVKHFATINGGMYDFNDTTFNIYTIAYTGIPDNSAVRVQRDTLNNRWYASPAGGLMIHYDFNYWSWFNTLNSGIGSNALTYVTIDSLDQKYLCSMQRGLIRFTPPGTWVIYDTASSPMPDVYTQCVEKENNHIVWVGTREKGLVRIDENPAGITDNLAENRQYAVFPNPAHPGRTLSFNAEMNISALNLYNVSGKFIDRLNVAFNAFTLPADLTSGLYFVECTGDDGKVIRMRFMVQ